MNILVLGDSDSSGEFNGGVAWPRLLEVQWRQSAGEPVSVRSVSFSAISRTAPAYAERKIAECRPDIVILVVGAFGFTFGFVELRLQRIFGKRAARWSKRVESRLDAGTRARGGRAVKANRVARRLARRVIGTETLISREQLQVNFAEVFRAIARFERTEVIILTYPGIGHHVYPRNAPANRKLFFAEVKRSADAHHFRWVSLDGLFADLTDWRGYAVDELHFNELGHRRIADTVERALR